MFQQDSPSSVHFSYSVSSWHRPVSLWLWQWSWPRNSDPQPSALIALLGSVKLPTCWLNRGQGTRCWPQTSCTIMYHFSSLFIFLHGFAVYPTLLITSPNAVPSASCFHSFQNQNSESRSWRRGWMPCEWAQHLWFWFVEHFIQS